MSHRIDTAWMEGSRPGVPEEFDRVWDALSEDEAWAPWLEEHIVKPGLYVIAQFEDRPKASMRRSGEDLIYYIPNDWVADAVKRGTVGELGRRIFEDAYAGWAKRLKAPAPPVSDGS